jgi:hypothetical protein
MRSPSILLAAALALASVAPVPALAGRLGNASAIRQKVTAGQKLGARNLVPRGDRHVTDKGKTNRVFPAVVVESDEKVFARLPRQGVANAMRRHDFARTLAHQLGWSKLVPPASELELASDVGGGTLRVNGKVDRQLTRGTPVMVVKDLGSKYLTFRELDEGGRGPSIAGAFPEELRLAGAVMHLLTWQLDGNPSNVMIKVGDGRVPGPEDVRVLDHDVTLGTKHTGPRINGSIFFRGKGLAYASRQASVNELPAAAKALVLELADASATDIADAYGLEQAEAALVNRTAQDIRASGLSSAVDHFWTDATQNYHDTDYHLRKKQGNP